MNKLLFSIGLLLFSVTTFAQDWAMVSSGAEFSAAIKSDGTLWTWGYNGIGQLGIPGTSEELSPVQVGTDNNWEIVECGGFHALAIKTDGTLWSWGSSENGQSAFEGLQVDEPMQIGTDADWDKLAAGQAHSLALKENGELYGWGWNGTGQIGNMESADQYEPVLIDASEWIEIDAGGYHSLGIKSDGSLWAWGYNANGQMGIEPETVNEVWNTPQLIDDTRNWTAISAGFEFSMGLDDENNLYSWGFNGNAQLGNGTENEVHVPTEIGEDQEWQLVYAASSFAFGLNSNNELFSWGFNGNGQLGQGDTDTRTTPTLVEGVSDSNYISAAEGVNFQNVVYGGHSVVLRNNGMNMCSTGANYIGQLGTGDNTPHTIFTCAMIIGIPEFPPLHDLKAYPNPASDYTNIKLPYADSGRYQLIDLEGRIVLNRMFNADIIQISRTDLPAGMYSVNINGSREHWSTKLIFE